MTRSMFSDDPILLVNAYLDGELDPANALAIEQRMAADPALAAEYTRIGALQRLLRERRPAKLRCRVCAPASRHPPA
jgi:anti-sigma factor RsiW